MRYLTSLICCLSMISAFSEDGKKEFSINDISIASNPDTPANPQNPVSIISTDEVFPFPQGGTITFESVKDSSRLAYPIEESNYEKLFGKNK